MATCSRSCVPLSRPFKFTLYTNPAFDLTSQICRKQSSSGPGAIVTSTLFLLQSPGVRTLGSRSTRIPTSPFTMPMNRYFECGCCGKEFRAGQEARERHCHSKGHARPRFECDTCCRWFRSEGARRRHMVDCNHFAKICSQCDATYLTEEEVKEHEIDDHYYCAECDRVFNNGNNIKMVSKRRPCLMFPYQSLTHS